MAEEGGRSFQDLLPFAVSFVRRALRYAWIGLVILAIGAGVTIVMIRGVKRTYLSEAVVMYQRGIHSNYVGANVPESESPKQIGIKLREMLLSRQRLRTVVQEFNLYPRVVDRRGYVEAVEEMRSHLSFSAKDGYTYRISFEAATPELAQAVTARIAQSMVDEDAAIRRREADDTKKFLDNEKRRVEADLRKREAELSSFLVRHPEYADNATAIVMGSPTTLLMPAGQASPRERARSHPSDLETLERRLARLQDQLARAEQGLPPPPKPAAAAAPRDPALVAQEAQAQSDLAAAQRELSDRQAKFTDEHPDVKAARSRVRGAEAALARARAALAASKTELAAPAGDVTEAAPNAPVAELRERIVVVKAQIAAKKKKGGDGEQAATAAATVLSPDTEFARVTRELMSARQRQSELQDKQFQAGLLATLESSREAGQLVIIDPAFRPTRPYTGSRTKVAIMGAAVSMLLALAAMALGGLLDDHVFTPADLTRALREVPVVVVPKKG